MNDEEILKLIKAINKDKEKPVKETPVLRVPEPFKIKFHHGQKILVTSGYYATYKGFIKDMRINDNKIEYLIVFKRIEDTEKWIPEEHIKTAWF